MVGDVHVPGRNRVLSIMLKLRAGTGVADIASILQ
jgi:hypothetical protein